MNQQNVDLIGALISLVLVLWPFVKSYAAALESRLMAKLPANTHNLFVSIADEVTRATEQLRKSNQISDEERKQNAAEAMKTILARLGFNTKDENLINSIGTYIESAVASMPKSGATGAHDYDTGSVAAESNADFLLDTVPASAAPTEATTPST